MKIVIGFSLAALVFCFPMAHAAQPIASCIACHGTDGNTTLPIMPRLGGQQVTYLINQLIAYKDKTRADSNGVKSMYGVTSKLDDATIQEMAEYFASQPPASGIGGAPLLVAAGKKIYENGIPAKNIPQCISCHGNAGTGSVADAFPRLAGQNPKYFIKQMEYYQTAERADPAWLPSEMDTKYLMTSMAKDMTPDEISSVAAYLASYSYKECHWFCED